MIRILPFCRKYLDIPPYVVLSAKQYFKGTTNFANSFCAVGTPNESDNVNTALQRYLHSKIISCGPMTIADYMKEVLTNPTAGYYMTKDVFGTKGDFITSPEITQLFGELIAVWIINEWSKISTQPFQLVELGSGRATLLKDILRVFKKLKYIDKLTIHIIEISPALATIQANNLCTVTINSSDIKTSEVQKNALTHYMKGTTEDGINIFWYYSIQDVPRKFSIFLAQEFFDALPIHKFQKTTDGWKEVLVDVTSEKTEQKFRYVLSASSTPAAKVYIKKCEKRDHIEISPQAMVLIDYIATFLMECGGFALIIDYGHNGDRTDTFRAFRRHKLHDPLVSPGTADLTADVDFSMLRDIAERDNRVIAYGPETQRSFFKNIGIDLRLDVLLHSGTEEEKLLITSGYHMIIDEDKMGNRFKVLALFPAVLRKHLEAWPVAGFTT